LKTAPGNASATNVSGPLFQGLSTDELRRMLEASSEAEYRVGEWLYAQGEAARNLHYLASGLIKLYEIAPCGKETLVRFISPGEVFGYFGLVGGTNIASARVARPSRVRTWDAPTALDLLQHIPKAATNLFAITVRDVMYFYERVRQLRTEPVDKRVRWALSELMRAIGRKGSDGAVIVQHDTGQRELAELASTTIYTVSRELSKLEREGILQKVRGRIVVLRPEEVGRT
jgi:CRP/FNR family transcriptional regulator, nitrogen oxide reductase regulator